MTSTFHFVGYRAFVLVIAIAYMTVILVTPRPSWQPGPVPHALLTVLGLVYLALGIWGFDFAQRQRKLILSLAYLGVEFALGMYISNLAPGGLLPMILLPIAAQAVSILPRWWAVVICALVIAGISGNLTWVPAWPYWFRNIAIAAAAVLFVVVYVGAATRERQARVRAEELSDEVAQLAAANERNRIARDIHDTLGHYLTIIHVQLEAARAVIASDPERGLFAVNRAQTLAKDGLAAVRQSVKALREDADVEGIADQIAALVDTVRDETFTATFTCSGTPRPVRAATALALHRTTLEALTNVRRHADARAVQIELTFRDDQRVDLRVKDDGRGAGVVEMSGFGLKGIRERAEQLGGTVMHRTAPGEGFLLQVELPA
jgi:signal transduction histidine kinase